MASQVRAGEFEKIAEEKTANMEVFEDQISSLQNQLSGLTTENEVSRGTVLFLL
jgi:hypothetical protein